MRSNASLKTTLGSVSKIEALDLVIMQALLFFFNPLLLFLCPPQLWPPHSFGTLSESPTKRIIKNQNNSD